MYHSGRNPLRRITRQGERVAVVRGLKQRRLHKALLRYHDAANWPLLREALSRIGRADLIGNGKRHLVPAWQPGSSGAEPQAAAGRGQRARKPAQRPKSRRRKAATKPRRR
jgi:hypothetical protein